MQLVEVICAGAITAEVTALPLPQGIRYAYLIRRGAARLAADYGFVTRAEASARATRAMETNAAGDLTHRHASQGLYEAAP